MKSTLLIFLGIVALFAPAHGALQYTITDLGVFPDQYGNTSYTPNSVALGINNSGQIAGAVSMTPYYAEAAIFGFGGITPLGTFAGSSAITNTRSIATGINNLGQVIGDSTNRIQGNETGAHAFLLSSGVMLDLGTFGGSVSHAYGLNDTGQVVGSAQTSSGLSHAFSYSAGTMTDLGADGLNSEAFSINNSGQVVGRFNNSHAFLYSSGTMNDLGSLGGTSSIAYGINDIGQIVGVSTLSGSPYQHAFLYSGGAMSDLGTLGGLGSNAYAINNNGQVFGTSSLANGDEHPFLYTDGVMYNLDDLITDRGGVGNFIVQGSESINDAGQIVGYGSIGGVGHAILLTPTVVPEPSTMFFGVMAGLAGIFFRRTRNDRNA